MKKILTFILIFLFVLALTGCAPRKIALSNGQTVNTTANFYIIKELYPSSFGTYAVKLCYDPDTKVMYYVIGTEASYSFGVSPYYLSNGELGIYGENYK